MTQRGKRPGTRTGCLMLAALLVPMAGWGAPFTNVVQLVLREGDVPTTNGTAISGAPAYSGTVDTYVDAANPTTSYGADPTVRFGWPGTDPAVRLRGYLRFDGFETYLPAGAKITRAVLYLTSAGSSAGNNGPQIFCRKSTWDESLTWNTDTDWANTLVIGHMYLGTWALQPSNDVAWLDITAYIQAWQTGALSNHGLQWRADGGWGDPLVATFTFFSSEYSDTTKRPRLVIDYVEPGSIERISMLGTTASMKLRMEYLRGAAVFDDTYIASKYYGGDVDQGDTNFASATEANLQCYNRPNAPRRALFKFKMNHPKLVTLAKSTDAIQIGQPRLISAYFQTVGYWSWDAPYKSWRLAQDWDVNQVTHNNRYTIPVNQPWAQPWPGTDTPMSNVVALAATSTGDNQWHRGGTKLTDITALLQMYVDGTNNTGILYGFDGWAPYDNIVCFTEDSLDFRRPTIIMEVWDPVLRGTLVLVK